MDELAKSLGFAQLVVLYGGDSTEKGFYGFFRGADLRYIVYYIIVYCIIFIVRKDPKSFVCSKITAPGNSTPFLRPHKLRLPSQEDEIQKSHDPAALSRVDQLGVEYGECGSGKLHSALSGRHL